MAFAISFEYVAIVMVAEIGPRCKDGTAYVLVLLSWDLWRTAAPTYSRRLLAKLRFTVCLNRGCPFTTGA